MEGTALKSRVTKNCLKKSILQAVSRAISSIFSIHVMQSKHAFIRLYSKLPKMFDKLFMTLRDTLRLLIEKGGGLNFRGIEKN